MYVRIVSLVSAIPKVNADENNYSLSTNLWGPRRGVIAGTQYFHVVYTRDMCMRVKHAIV